MKKTRHADYSKLDAYQFEYPLTLDEIEWTRILGPTGLGCQLLDAMAELAGPHFRLEAICRNAQPGAELLEFDLEGNHAVIRLDYEQPLNSTLTSAMRRVIDGVNQAMKRARVSCRFVVLRDACAGSQSGYRLVLAPTAWLSELGADPRLVAGVTPDDYEVPPGALPGDALDWGLRTLR